MSTTSDEATADPATRLEEAREYAEAGDLDRAAALYRQILELGDTPVRAQAGLGLAVVLEGSGDHAGARAADRTAIATGDAEYGARAAYHLALNCERFGEHDEARAAWRTVVEFGNDAYLPPAYLALAQHADDEGDHLGAREHWERVIAAGDPQYAPLAAHDLGLRLLEWGEPARAQRVLAGGLEMVDRRRDPHGHARLAVSLGIAHLEQAIGAFGSVAPGADADPEVVPLAIELLARTLPLRGREEAAQDVWRRGLDDPRLGEHVRARLRRTLSDEEQWWDGDLEAAIRAGTAPALAEEALAAVDHMYELIATRYAQGRLPEAVLDAIRVPSDYPWGHTLHDSFAERLRRAMGSDTPVLPPGWPDTQE